jgi:tetratricopeptide (TPR) repeat protein
LKRVLHGQIGEFVEITFADSLSERIDLLAYHFYQGHVWSKALPYNLQAGERAKTEFANDIAITSFEHALEAIDALGDEQDTSRERESAHVLLGDVLTLVGRYVDALQHFDFARVLVGADPTLKNHNRRMADLYRKTADVFERQSEYETAFQWLDQGLHLLDEDPIGLETAQIYLMGAGLHHRQANNDEAVNWCQKSLEATSKIDTRDSRHVTAHTYYLQGAAHYRLADFDQALKACEESLRLYEEIDDYVGQARAYNNLAIVYSDIGDWAKSSEAYHQSLGINQKIGNIQEQGFVANNLGNVHQYRGDWDRAVELYQESNAIWKKIGAPLPDAVTMSNLAQIHIYRKNWKEALESLRQSQALFEKIGSKDFLPELDRRWAEYYLHTGDPEKALESVKRSIDVASEHETRLEQGMSFRVLGEVEMARGDRDAAEDALLRSLRILNELNSEYEEAKTKLSLARLGLLSKNDESYATYLAEAIEAFDKLGAKADLKVARGLEEL